MVKIIIHCSISCWKENEDIIYMKQKSFENTNEYKVKLSTLYF